MKKILIDTNGLISFVIDRNEKQNQFMYDILSNKNSFHVYLISNVISEFVYVLNKIYLLDPKKITVMINDLLKMPNVNFIEGYFPDLIFNLWPGKIKDFGDSVLAAASITVKLPIYTFDKKLSQQLNKINCKHKLILS